MRTTQTPGAVRLEPAPAAVDLLFSFLAGPVA